MVAPVELHAWAARQGGNVVLEEQESAEGSSEVRPRLLRVMEAARRREVDTVAVWKLDRFGKSAVDLLANIRALTDVGCRFVAVRQGLYVRPGGDTMSILLLTMLAALAEFERDRIREQTLLGLARARARGVELGRPRADGPTSAEVRRLRARGRSWSEIASELGCTIATARRRAVETPPTPKAGRGRQKRLGQAGARRRTRTKSSRRKGS